MDNQALRHDTPEKNVCILGLEAVPSLTIGGQKTPEKRLVHAAIVHSITFNSHSNLTRKHATITNLSGAFMMYLSQCKENIDRYLFCRRWSIICCHKPNSGEMPNKRGESGCKNETTKSKSIYISKQLDCSRVYERLRQIL